MFVRYLIFSITCLTFLQLTGCEFEDTAGSGGGDSDPEKIRFIDVSTPNIQGILRINNALDVEAADINSDGATDLIYAMEFSANRILLNNGAGNFSDRTPTQMLSNQLDSEEVTISDFNGDDRPDLFFANGEAKVNELYLNRGNGFLNASNRIPVTGTSLSSVHADILNDGDQDILIGNDGQNTMIANTGTGYFAQASERLPNNQGISFDLAGGDITGDNRTDIIVGNDIDNQILINTESGFLVNATTERLPLIGDIEETRDVEIADLNGDNAADLYFANVGLEPGADAQDRLLINNGSGIFGDSTNTDLPEINTHTVAAEIADLNQDGANDIIIGNMNGGIRVLINDESGTFTDQTGQWIPETLEPQVQDLLVAQLNNDSLPDLYVAARGDEPDYLLLQKSK